LAHLHKFMWILAPVTPTLPHSMYVNACTIHSHEPRESRTQHGHLISLKFLGSVVAKPWYLNFALHKVEMVTEFQFAVIRAIPRRTSSIRASFLWTGWWGRRPSSPWTISWDVFFPAFSKDIPPPVNCLETQTVGGDAVMYDTVVTQQWRWILNLQTYRPTFITAPI